MQNEDLFQYQTIEGRHDQITDAINEFAKDGWRVVGFTCVATTKPWLFVALLEKKR
ncbi:MAG: DUF4177 domain-containing protein [Acidobacteriia bacterium]|nr:DUF4177 domain-containing protein [Terriglobia bacterium]